MNEQQRTEIATLGEFGLIRRLTDDIKPVNASTRYGVGDDCAVLSYPADREVLVTTDMLMEGVHFDLTYVPLKHLGYKAAMVNLSDIYAMNGTPHQLTVSLALSKRFCIEDVEDLYWPANNTEWILWAATPPPASRDWPSASPVSAKHARRTSSIETVPRKQTSSA